MSKTTKGILIGVGAVIVLALLYNNSRSKSKTAAASPKGYATEKPITANGPDANATDAKTGKPLKNKVN